MTAGGLPHSETLGSKPCRRLPEDYRGPTRPSSVLSAKASTTAPFTTTRHQPEGPWRRPPRTHNEKHNNLCPTGTLDYQIITHINHTPQKKGHGRHETNERTHTPANQADASRPHHPPQRWTMRLGSFTVRTPTTPPKGHGRCSRPLSSSQTTTTPRTPHDTNRRHARPMGEEPPTPQKGRGDPGTQQHAPHHNRPTGRQPSISSTPARTTPTPTGAENASSHNRTPHGRPAKTP